MLSRLFRRRKADAELNDEIRFYLDQETQLRIDRGESPDDARRAARRDFGSVLLVQETTRRTWGWSILEDLGRDLRFGARILLRSPLSALTAILSLALGIGANTAIFSLMDLVMIRSLPVSEPHRLVQLQKLHAAGTRGGLSYPMFEELRRDLSSFDDLLAQGDILARDVVMEGRGETVKAQLVSGNYFELLGVGAQLGRVFTGGDSSPVAVIGRRFWRRRFAEDPAVLGKSLQLGKAVLTIVGVTPPEFFGTVPGDVPDIVIPISMDGAIRGGKSWTVERGISWLSVLGRLRPGITIAQAQTEAAPVFARILDANKEMRTGRARDNFLAQRLALYPAAGGFDDLRRRFSEPLAILMGVVGLVLLIVCANLANLLLARSVARGREIAVRLAIGAGRGRVVRQLLVEGLLLAVIGCSLGVSLALAFGNWLVAVMSNGGERIALQVRPDLRVLSFALGISLAACLLFSLAPAVQAARGSLHSAFADLRAPRWRLGRGLIVAQVAITLLLLIGAGLFGRTLYNIYSQDVGFDRRNVITFSLNTAKAGYRDDAIPGLYTALLADLRSMPGVISASAAMAPPVSGLVWDSTLSIEGYTYTPQENTETTLNAVAPDYFRTIGTPVVAGRDFDGGDTPASKRVAIVNESFARYYFKSASPLGRWVRRNPVQFEIVGVVKDTKHRNLREPSPRMVYLAAAQQESGRGWNSLLVRTAGDPSTLLRSIESAVQRIDRALRVVEPLTMDQLASRSLLHERILGMLAAFFGAFAVLLSAVGIYGVTAFQVARRRKEIGIRVALGASPHDVLSMLVGQTARLFVIGASIGVPSAIVLSRFTEKILFGIGPADPATFIAAVAALGLVAVIAAWLPGRAATRVDPVESLRCD